MLSKSIGWISVLLIVAFWVIPFSIEQSYQIHLAASVGAIVVGLYAAFTSSRIWLISSFAAFITFALFISGAAANLTPFP